MKNKDSFIIGLMLKFIIWGFLLLVIWAGIGFFMIKLPLSVKYLSNYAKHILNRVRTPVGILAFIFLIILPGVVLIIDIKNFFKKT